MDDENSYENKPSTGAASAFAAKIYPLAQAIDTPSGSMHSISGCHDRFSLRIWSEFC
jgi:hypothetical protein